MLTSIISCAWLRAHHLMGQTMFQPSESKFYLYFLTRAFQLPEAFAEASHLVSNISFLDIPKETSSNPSLVYSSRYVLDKPFGERAISLIWCINGRLQFDSWTRCQDNNDSKCIVSLAYFICCTWSSRYYNGIFYIHHPIDPQNQSMACSSFSELNLHEKFLAIKH